MADHEVQPPKKLCVETGESLPLPSGVVSLSLPAGVAIPQFYHEERDAYMVSTALQLGADAVCYLRRRATDERLKELTEQKESELNRSIKKVEAKLSVVSEDADREVQRRVEELKLVVKQELELRDKYRDEKASELRKTREELNQQCSDSLADLQTQKEAQRQLDAAMLTVRTNERQKANDDVNRKLVVLDDQVKYLDDLLKFLKEDGKKQQELLKQVFELARERQQTVVKSAAAARHSIQKKGAIGEFNLGTLIKNAFGMVEDFSLRDTTRSKPGKTGDFVAQIWGLETLWDCKNYSSTVDATQIEKIKRDLKHNPSVDVAFLVSLKTGISGHLGSIFDVEIVSPRQTLVYVNELLNNDDPVNLLQVFARPLFKALRHVKQAYADGRNDDADSWALFVQRWTPKVSEQIKDLQDERREFNEEKRQSEQRFAERENLILNREAALKALLKDVSAPR